MKNIIKNGCLLAIMVLLSCTCARAQHDSINYTDAKGLKQGKWVIYDTLDYVKFKTIGYYKDNLEDSVWNTYYFKGNLKSCGYYKRGKKDGVAHIFKGNGIINHIYVYKEDKSIWSMTFNKEGCPFKEVNAVNYGEIYYKNGKWEDAVPTPDTIAANFTDTKGLKQGKWMTTDTVDGIILKTIGYYKDNLRDSILNSYYLNGNLMQRCYYKRGINDGVTHIFKKDGTILGIGVYKDGNFIWSMMFNKQGYPLTEDNEEIEGTIYYENGKWKKK